MKRLTFGVRGRIVGGFLVLAAAVVVSGALSIHELRRMSREVRAMMRDSYRSVQYSQGMLDALSGENTALLRYVAGGSGSRREAEVAFSREHVQFSKYRLLAHGNITHEGERALLDGVDTACVAYMAAANRLLQQESPTLRDYMEVMSPAKEGVRRAVQDLLLLNQGALYDASRLIESLPERSFRPGLIVAMVGVMFALASVYLLTVFFVRPILSMRNATEGYLKYRDRRPVRLSTGDELEELWDAIDRLMDRCDEGEGRHRGV